MTCITPIRVLKALSMLHAVNSKRFFLKDLTKQTKLHPYLIGVEAFRFRNNSWFFESYCAQCFSVIKNIWKSSNTLSLVTPYVRSPNIPPLFFLIIPSHAKSPFTVIQFPSHPSQLRKHNLFIYWLKLQDASDAYSYIFIHPILENISLQIENEYAV